MSDITKRQTVAFTLNWMFFSIVWFMSFQSGSSWAFAAALICVVMAFRRFPYAKKDGPWKWPYVGLMCFLVFGALNKRDLMPELLQPVGLALFSKTVLVLGWVLGSFLAGIAWLRGNKDMRTKQGPS